MTWTFRWPWIARSSHEAIVAAKDEHIAALGQVLGTTREERKAVLDRFLDREAPAPVTVTPRERRPHDAADTAIDFVAQGDPMKRRFLERYAKSERAKGKEAGDIAAAILNPPVISDEDGY